MASLCLDIMYAHVFILIIVCLDSWLFSANFIQDFVSFFFNIWSYEWMNGSLTTLLKRSLLKSSRSESRQNSIYFAKCSNKFVSEGFEPLTF